MVTTPVLVTYKESLLRPESSHEEVINGELHIVPPSTYFHNSIVFNIVKLLMGQLGPELTPIWNTGFLIAERPRLRYRIPDLAVADSAALQLLADSHDVYARFPPLAVVEVLSPANRKGNVAQLLQDYRDLGVKEIIFIDPKERTVVIDGVLITSDRFTIAEVSFQVNDLW